MTLYAAQQQERTRRTLATFADAWHDLDGQVESSETLLQEALRASPQDEGLLRLRAWSLSWGPINTHRAIVQHHLQRWLDLAPGPVGQATFARFTHEASPGTAMAIEGPSLLALALPSLPATALAAIAREAPAQNAWWLPLQTLMVLTPNRAHTTLLNAWRSVDAIGATSPLPALQDQPWLDPNGQPEPLQPTRSAWWQIVAGHDGLTVPHLMRHGREASRLERPLRGPAPDPSGPRSPDGDRPRLETPPMGVRALLAGFEFVHQMARQAPSSLPDPMTSRYTVWMREARAWIESGARLPHDVRFDLPRSETLPNHGIGLAGHASFDDAVSLMDHATRKAPVECDTWYLLWNTLRATEARCVERDLLHATAQAALDEQGHEAGHLKTRRRL